MLRTVGRSFETLKEYLTVLDFQGSFSNGTLTCVMALHFAFENYFSFVACGPPHRQFILPFVQYATAMNHFAAIFLVGPYEALKRGPKPGRRKVETPEDRQCKHCGKMYITSAVRRRHEMIHLNIKPFHCIYCPKKFNRNDTCKMHIKSHEKPMSFQCLKCKGLFVNSELLKEHVANCLLQY